MSIDVEQVINDTIRRQRYLGYLESSKWTAKRHEKLVSVNYTCEECGYNRETCFPEIPLDVHHLTYDNLGDEPMQDLQVLCRQCHMRKHGRSF